VTTVELIGLQPTADPLRWSLPITKVMTTARGALYGGAGLAAVIAALEVSTGRALVWATAQYLSFVRMPAVLDVRLQTPVVGARTTQARGTVFHGDDEILTVLATLGHRDEEAHWTYAEPPDVPAPAETRRQSVAEADGTIHDLLDMRIVRGVSRRQLLRGKPAVETGGRAAYWVRDLGEQPRQHDPRRRAGGDGVDPRRRARPRRRRRLRPRHRPPLVRGRHAARHGQPIGLRETAPLTWNGCGASSAGSGASWPGRCCD
jgi:hypothetical protein